MSLVCFWNYGEIKGITQSPASEYRVESHPTIKNLTTQRSRNVEDEGVVKICECMKSNGISALQNLS